MQGHKNGQSDTIKRFLTSSSLSSEHGNVFFALFGAIAVVGILGAGIMTTMRGPLSTMVQVQSNAKAESEMAIASRLVLLEATELANNGDCDSDNFIEPLEHSDAGGNGPVGGGFLPLAVGSSRIDPWGTEYGYCAWDAGVTINDVANCDLDGVAGNQRLDGNTLDDSTYTVIALISAGPDQEFDTSCVGGGAPSVSKGGDDLVSEFTYAEASAATGGLWKLKSGEPGTAEISKELEVSGDIDLSLDGAGTGQLILGAASMLLPDESTLSTCSSANKGLIRINSATNPDTLQICSEDTNNPGNYDWWGVSSGSTGLWTNGTGDKIYYDATTPQVGIGKTDPVEALDVVGNIAASGDITAGGNLAGTDLALSGNAAIGGTLGVTGTSSLAAVNATGAADFDSTLNVDGASTLDATTVTTLGATGAVDFDSTLNVDGDSTLNGDAFVSGDVRISGGLEVDLDSSFHDTATFDSTIDAQGSISNSTGNVDVSDDLDVSGNVDASGDLIGDNLDIATNADIDGTLEADEYTWNGNDFTPESCSSGEYSWWDGNSWECSADQNDGSGVGSGVIVAGIFEVNETPDPDVVRMKTAVGTGYGSVDFVFGSPQLADDGNADHESRMFFDKSKYAFRAGFTNADDWDDSNVGIASVAMGENTRASGQSSTAIGAFSWATGTGSLGLASGSGTGEHSIGIGYGSLASGENSIALGSSVVAGNGVAGSGSGDYSMAVGLGNQSGTAPTVTGDFSLGIFMGDQSGYNLSTNSRMALIGGDFLIDNDGALGSQGCIRYSGTELEFSDDCTTFTSFADIGGTPGGADTQVQYNDNGAFAGDAGLTYDDANNILTVGNSVVITGQSGNAPSFIALDDLDDVTLSASANGECLVYDGTQWENGTCGGSTDVTSGIFEIASNVARVKDAAGDWAVDDFVFGSPQLDDDGDATHDARMFFDKSKGAFRAGQVTGTEWDDASVGASSFAGGSSTASGASSTAFGSGSTASGAESFSVGTGSIASNNASIALGHTITVSGDYSSGFGRDVRTTGTNSVGFGLGDATGTRPTVSGNASFGIFMGDQSAYDLTTANRMALVGGHFMIDDAGATGSQGCIRYNGTSSELEYSNDCTTYASLAGAADLWTDNTTHITRESFHILDSGQTSDSTALSLAGGSTDTMAVFYDPDKRALRGGLLDVGDSNNDAWNNANIGNNSFTWGHNAEASGNGSFAAGTFVTASGLNSTALGRYNTASAMRSTVMGYQSTASGDTSFAAGYSATASGDTSFALGTEVQATGTRSFAVGLGDATGTFPRVSGTYSMGIFMGDQSAYDLSVANRMALVGGDLLIDDAGATGSQGCIRYNGTNSELEFSDDCTTYTALADAGSASGVFEVTGGAGTELVRQVAANAPLLTSDFVFGSTQLADTGTADHDSRMFFDKSKGAFRAGVAEGTEWDDASVGTASVAMGYRPNANGAYSTAIGLGARANAYGAVALGGNVTAGHTSGSGTYSVALGQTTQTTGNASMAIGLGAATGTYPIVSATNSLGIFMGDQSGYDFTTANTMGLIGGNLYIRNSGIPKLTFEMGGATSDSIVFQNMATNRTSRLNWNNQAYISGSSSYSSEDSNLTFWAGASSTPFAGGASSFRIDGSTDGFDTASDNAFSFDYTVNKATSGNDTGLLITRTETAAAGVSLLIDAKNGGTTQFSVGDQGNLYANGVVTLDGGTGNQSGCIRFDDTTDKIQYSHDCSTYADMGVLSGALALNDLSDAMANLATDGNMFIGHEGTSVTAGSGIRNLMIGQTAGDSITTGDENVGIGRGALTSVTTTSDNVALGNYALYNNVSDENTAIGTGAMRYYSGAGDGNTAVGNMAGPAAAGGLSATGNVSVGTNALNTTTAGDGNVAVGGMSLAANRAKGESTAVGYGSMRHMDSTTTEVPSYNSSLGFNSLRGATADDTLNTGTGNTAIGHTAIQNITSGNNNTALGYLAGDTISSGTNNIALGYNADFTDGTASNQLNIGNTIYGDLANDYVGIGDFSADTIDSALHLASGDIRLDGGAANQAGCIRYDDTTDKLQFSHDCSTYSDLGSASSMAINDLTDAIAEYTTAYNMFLGSSAGNATTTGQYNTALGQSSLLALSSGACSGSQCDANTALGYATLTANTTGYINVAIGTNAMGSNVSGFGNIAIGSSALRTVTGSDQNTAIGTSAARYNTGNANVALGYNALIGVNGSSTGGTNVALGFQAGDSITTGTGNILLGYDVDTPIATTSSHLNIGNTIYGDLANDYVGIGINPDTAKLHVDGGGGVLIRATAGGAARFVLDDGTGHAVMRLYNGAQSPQITLNSYGWSWFNNQRLGVGTDSPDTKFHVEEEDASNSSVTSVVRLTHITDGVPAAGIGVGMEFEAETAANNNEIGATIRAVTSDVTATSEDFDLTFGTMTAGATASEKMRIASTGYVGIGTPSPASELHVVGDIRFTGVMIDASDERLKTDIVPLTDKGDLLGRLKQIKGYSFRMKDDKKGQIEYGVMAQEIEKVFPELVKTADDKMGTKSVNYLGLIAPMIEATKELSAENNALKAALAARDSKMAALEATMEDRLAALESDMNGMKLYTGYGTQKAALGLLFVLTMLGSLGGLFYLRKKGA